VSLLAIADSFYIGVIDVTAATFWYIEELGLPKTRSFQADFFVGRENSITFPRSSGGIHFVRLEKLAGM
jgi:hypothetical protein